MRWVIAFVTAAVVFLAMDFTWLSQTNATVYRPIIGELLSPTLRVGPAIAFYVLYLAGLTFFAVAPGLAGGGMKRVALNAAVYGLCAYATYDLTNQATLKVWSTMLTALDLGWGVIVSTVAACAGYRAARLIRGPTRSTPQVVS
jgi:uncharacterized membrane protein